MIVIRRYTPFLLFLLLIWSFITSFVLGMCLLTIILIAAISIYQVSSKKWQEMTSDDFAVHTFADIDSEDN